ncbi:MAG: glycosyltransferase family 4 protein [Aristaeellaceae bacterium]
MDVLVVADGHYYRDANDNVYAETTYDYNFYKRYLTVFDKVYAVVRTEKVDCVKGKKLSSGPNVEFLDLPAYTGPWEYAMKYLAIRRLAKKYCQHTPCAIFRLPAATANVMCSVFSRTGKPFAVEIVVDPWENFAPGSIDSILRPMIRYSWTKIVKDMCLRAIGAAYVTESYLQRLYPCRAMKGDHRAFTAAYSSVELPDDCFAAPRTYSRKAKWHIAHVANTFADNGKGHRVLIDALALVRNRGYDVTVTFIGDGPKRSEFEAYAREKQVYEYTKFLGRLPSGLEVKRVLADADLFVFPTKAEGLPRGLLEAMSEGLPCLSSPTCGIPEVLEKEFLIDYDDSNGFAEGIIRCINDPTLMERMSKKNLETARMFRASVLNSRRMSFYNQLKHAAEGV